MIRGVHPPLGYVPNQETALKIAEAIWLPVYGDKIYDSLPFTAVLKNDVWIVSGTLPAGMRGGTPYIEIKKTTCQVLIMYHGK